MQKPKKIILTLLAVLFLLSLTSLSIGYHYLMLSHNMENLIKSFFEKYTNGEVQLKVKSASLIYGFKIEDFYLRERNTKEKLLYVKRASLRTFLPGILAGEISIRNLILEDGHLYMTHKNDRWNWGLVFNPDMIEKPDTEIPEKISLIFPVRAHMNIVLNNFSYHLKMNKNKTSKADLQLDLKNIDIQLGIITQTITEIPLGLDISAIFDTFLFTIDFADSMRYSSGTRRQIIANPKLKFYIFREDKSNILEFHSHLFVDTKSMRLINNRGNSLTIDSQLKYNLLYNSLVDRLNINSLELRNKNETWFNINGAINHVTKKDRTLQVNLEDAHIDLNKVGEIIANIGGLAQIPLYGYINIKNIVMFGNLHKLRLQSEFFANKLLFGIKKTHKIESLDIDLDAQLDILSFLPFLREYDDEKYKINNELSFGFLYYLRMRQFELVHDRGYFKAEGLISSRDGTKADIQMRDVNIDFFTDNTFGGTAIADISLNSSSDFKKTKFDLDFKAKNVVYTIARSRSSLQHFNAKAKGYLKLQKNFKVFIDNILLEGKTISGKKFLDINAEGVASLAKGTVDYNAKNLSLSLNVDRLYPIFPDYLKDFISPYHNYIKNRAGKNLRLKARDLGIKLSDFEKNYAMKLQLELPALRLDDLDINLNLKLLTDKLLVNKFTVSGLQGFLGGNLEGYLNRKEFKSSNLKGDLRVFSKNFVRVHKNIFMQGDFNFNFEIAKKKLQAKAYIAGLNFEYLNGDCNILDSESCKSLFVHNVTLKDFSIKHSFDENTFSARDERIQTPPSYEQGPYRPNIYNFTIDRVSSSHNPGGSYLKKKSRWHYIGSPGRKQALQAVLKYNKNTLRIPHIKILHLNLRKKRSKDFWKKNGVIRGKNIYINLADLKAKNIKAGFHFKIQKFNANPFLPNPDDDYEGIISADIKGQANSFEGNLLEKINSSIIIHKTNEKFAGFITHIFFPQKVITSIVRNTLEIPSIRLRLHNGLVYSYIKVRRASIIPGILISSTNEEIKQERIPIALFFKRASIIDSDASKSFSQNKGIK